MLIFSVFLLDRNKEFLLEIPLPSLLHQPDKTGQDNPQLFQNLHRQRGKWPDSPQIMLQAAFKHVDLKTLFTWCDLGLGNLDLKRLSDSLVWKCKFGKPTNTDFFQVHTVANLLCSSVRFLQKLESKL